MKKHILLVVIILLFILSAIAGIAQTGDAMPEPFATKSVMNFSNVVGWKDGETPKAPAGFRVKMYAHNFENPRWMYVLPNGDVLVAESNKELSLVMQAGGAVAGVGKSNNLKKSADRITLLRHSNNAELPDLRDTFLKDLNQPFGMLLLNDWFYVANTDAIMRYPYRKGTTCIKDSGQKIIDLPAGKHNQHWTRNIIANKDGSKIYVAIGSGSNIGEHGMANEVQRACILEINPDGTDQRIYASGLRNPVGMDISPGTNTLWTTVNERDELGDDLVPDYLTHVEKGSFYGWPYSYFGQHIDPRVKEQQPEMVKKAIVPDVDLGAHTASLGLLFYTGKDFPAKYRNGAFVAQHGSWNRSELSGYKVVFVPFSKGQPTGGAQDFLTGFIIDPDKDEVRGRPTGLAMLHDGSLLLTDDYNNIIWRISAVK